MSKEAVLHENMKAIEETTALLRRALVPSPGAGRWRSYDRFHCIRRAASGLYG